MPVKAMIHAHTDLTRDSTAISRPRVEFCARDSTCVFCVRRDVRMRNTDFHADNSSADTGTSACAAPERNCARPVCSCVTAHTDTEQQSARAVGHLFSTSIALTQPSVLHNSTQRDQLYLGETSASRS